MKLTLTNIRGFVGVHPIVIRPITILVGENSSGKSTLLAALNAALHPDFPTAEHLFNRPPFDLGGFSTIVSTKRGSHARPEYFSIGWDSNADAPPLKIHAKFGEADGYPRLDGLILRDSGCELHVDVRENQYEFTCKLIGIEKKATGRSPEPHKTVQFRTSVSREHPLRLQDIPRYYVSTLSREQRTNKFDQLVIEALFSLEFNVRRFRPHATAFAPVRTRPRRTYDEMTDEFRPEGDHVPIVLAKLLAGRNGERKHPSVDALNEFGRASGLFKKVDVKRLGKQPSGPLQVRVKSDGLDANLVDVGYGVSQALPIVTDAIRAATGEVLLIQQPEVHLHPRAQAALGTMFCELSADSKKQFVIETHSDYLVDRVRLAIADKLITKEHVQILYLARSGTETKVHPISLDDAGNVVDAPSDYRDFFLREEMRLLGRAK